MNLRLAASTLIALALTACGPDPDPGTETPTSPSSAAPASGDLDLDGLKPGATPKIAWAKGTLLDGDTAKEVLPSSLDQFAETKQLLVMRDVDGNVYAYSPDGPTSKTPIGTATGRLAINTERNMVAWIAPDGSPTVLQEGHARPVVLQKQAGVTSGDAVAVLGHDCFNGPETVEGAGCSVYFRSNATDKPQSFAASNHGFVESLLANHALLNVQDADHAGFVGWTKLNADQTTCSTYFPNDDENGPTGKSWKTCDAMPLLLSPDGKHILATGPHGYEGLGASSLSILDRASGKPTLTLNNNEKSQAAIVDMVWEDATHVLAVVTQRYDWAIVRVGLDGSMERAGGAAVTIDETEELANVPFRLAVQP